MRRLQPQEFETFIETIGHSPKTAITIHYLRQNLLNVYLIGDVDNFTVAIVQETIFPAEPTGYGSDVRAMWEILSQMKNWEVIDIEPSIADELARLMQSEMSVPIKHYGDIYYQLNQQISHHHPNANIEFRLLSLADADMVKASGEEMQSLSYGSIEASLKQGIIAGAIVDNQLVAMSDSHRADKYINVGVITDENWRRKGLSTAAASLVIIEGQKRRLIPVWSAGKDNIASHRVAEKLGFGRVSERVYLIPQKQVAS